VKVEHQKPGGMNQEINIPTWKWEVINMDLITGLPRTRRQHDSIWVIVDRVTKSARFLDVKTKNLVEDYAKLYINEIVRLHGFPLSIVSDRDKVFLSQFWTELFRLSGTKLNKSTAYHPQSDGQTEVTNRGLETYLRCFAGEKPRTWSKFLQWAEFSYNTSIHSYTKISPFEAVYGVPPPNLLTYVLGTTRIQAVDELPRDREMILKELCQKLMVVMDES